MGNMLERLQNDPSVLQKENDIEISGLIDKKTNEVKILESGTKNTIPFSDYNYKKYTYFHTHPGENAYFKPPSAADLMQVLIRSAKYDDIVSELAYDEYGSYTYSPKYLDDVLSFSNQVYDYPLEEKKKILDEGMLNESMANVVNKWQDILDEMFSSAIVKKNTNGEFLSKYADMIKEEYENLPMIPFVVDFTPY
jgi:hypothetical protein